MDLIFYFLAGLGFPQGRSNLLYRPSSLSFQLVYVPQRDSMFIHNRKEIDPLYHASQTVSTVVQYRV